MSRVSRDTPAGRAYLDLQNLARRLRRPTAELLHTYALEAFLIRMGSCPQDGSLVLKGGVLMAAFAARRPTRDIDLALRDAPGEVEAVRDLVRRIVAVPLEDGLVFDADAVSAAVIRDEDQYSGVRVSLPCTLASAQIRFHVDVNVGDPIWPAPEPVVLDRLLGGGIEVLGYPLAMVYAEKIATAVDRGLGNTRWRDFADVYLLSRVHSQDGAQLRTALVTVAEHRGVALSSLSEVLQGYSDLAQSRWDAWRRKQLLDDRLPEAFAEVLDAVIAFADPCLIGAVASGEPSPDRWDPVRGQWC